MTDRVFQDWEDAVTWLLAQPDQQELVRACYYDYPRSQAAQRFRASAEWSATRELIAREPGMALDVGAGHGITSVALARDGWDVTALEPNPSALVGTAAIRALANESGVTIRTVETVGERLPFTSASFDLVYCRQVLHHASSLQAFCRELFRVLRPSGTLMAAREHVVSSQGQLERFRDAHPLHKLYGGENAFPLSTYLRALRDAGFHDVRTLGPFGTPVNYAPLDREGVRKRMREAMRGIPGGGIGARALSSDALFHLALRLVNRLDRRPGRLHTFVARKVS